MDEFEGLGKTIWAFSDGFIPLESNGPEPDNTSHDRLSILNTSSSDAKVSLMIYFTKEKPKGPYSIDVKGKSVRQFRFNDLIDPQAIPLSEAYGCVIKSTVPIIVQFCRFDTSWPPKAIYATFPYSS